MVAIQSGSCRFEADNVFFFGRQAGKPESAGSLCEWQRMELYGIEP